MKKISITLAIISALVVSCNKEPVPTILDTGISTTIMYYGATGFGSCLDDTFLQSMMEAMNVGCDGSVKFVAQYNFFREAQKYANLKGTSRFEVNVSDIKYQEPPFPAKGTQEDSLKIRIQATSEQLKKVTDAGGIKVQKLSDTPLHLWEPQVIADFIKWSVNNYPSDYYILIINGHGGGWTAWDDADDTKASGWDDNYGYQDEDSWIPNKPITAKGLVKGINQSGYASKISLLVQDACMMNQLENLSEYATTGIPLALLSFQSMTGMNMDELVYDLKDGSNFNDAIKKYVDENPRPDHTLWDMSKIGSTIIPAVAEMVPVFKNDYKAHVKDYDSMVASLQNVGGYYSYFKDFSQLMDLLQNKAFDATLKTKAAAVYKALDDATYTIFTNNKDKNNQTAWSKYCSAGALFLNKTAYASKKDNMDTFSANEFYAKTKWNTIFEEMSFTDPQGENAPKN